MARCFFDIHTVKFELDVMLAGNLDGVRAYRRHLEACCQCALDRHQPCGSCAAENEDFGRSHGVLEKTENAKRLENV